jgi:small ligand-binding sensory domain FIST
MRFGAGLAVTTDPGEAARQVVHQANVTLGGAPAQVGVLFASSHFLDDAELLLAAASEEAGAPPLIGCVAESVLGGNREIEHQAAVSIWLGAEMEPVETFSMEFLPSSAGGTFHGYHFEPGTYLMVSDPFSFPADSLLQHLNEHVPGAMAMGGLASGGLRPGQGRLFLDQTVLRTGCVGVRLGPRTPVELLVSQGCRPLGDPYTITGAEGNIIHELGGRTPVARLQHLAGTLTESDRQLLTKGVQMGLVIDEHKVERGAGDFLIRAVIGMDPRSGALAVGDQIRVGQTVQFHVRDADSADEDLKRTLQERLAGRPVSGALLFTCNGRGSRMFTEADHDAGLLTRMAGPMPLAGFFCAGELGPIGGKNFLHGFTASIAAFVDTDH